jgi:uncharacterized protein
MRRRQGLPGQKNVPLAAGTRVVLQQRYDDEKGFLKSGTMGQVRGLDEHGLVKVETPAGRLFTVPREHLVVQKKRVLDRALARHAGWLDYKDRVILATVVGSNAWGLAGPGSDQDIKGVFVLPFEDQAGFYKVSDEIQDPRGDCQYWEIGKLIHQALNADPNTLEALWSPLIVAVTPLGRLLLERRRIFVSDAIVGSFGRYALSQFKKIEQRLKKGEPGKLARPKNAYNLIRLLHSALSWIETGQPLITVTGEIRQELLAIKQSEVPIADVLKRGFDLAAEVEQAHANNNILPAEPDFDAAHELLVEIRRGAADQRVNLFTSVAVIPATVQPYPTLAEWDFQSLLAPKVSDIEAVIFDLDDTLFDCYGQCVLKAHREASQAMIDAGLNADIDDVYECRLKFRRGYPECRLEDMVSVALGSEVSAEVSRAGERAFFSRDPGQLTAFPDSCILVQSFKDKGCEVMIVTRGDDKTQQLKIDRLGFRELFDEIHVVPLGVSKSVALKSIADRRSADKILVVGDNIRDEIRDARDLGMHVCWLPRGEFRRDPIFRCWTLKSLSELLDWLQGLNDE